MSRGLGNGIAPATAAGYYGDAYALCLVRSP